MNLLFKLYLKLFLMTAIPFGLFMGLLYNLFIFSIVAVVYSGAIAGILYGISMSIILGSLHIVSVSKLGYGLSEKTIAVKHTRYFDLMAPYEQAFNLCVMSLESIRKSKLQRQNLSTGEIVARVHPNKFTWGDSISFKISPLSQERTQIQVTSKPALGTQVIDNGQNLKNIEKIVNFLTHSPEITSSRLGGE